MILLRIIIPTKKKIQNIKEHREQSDCLMSSLGRGWGKEQNGPHTKNYCCKFISSKEINFWISELENQKPKK